MKRVHVLLLTVLLVSLLNLHAADGWRFLHDDNGLRFSSYARSHLVLGLGRTQGRDLFFNPHNGHTETYGHHPPGLGLILAGWFQFWGRSDPFVARALAVCFHLVTVGIVFALLARPAWDGPALVAGLALASVPMSSFFGKMVNHEPFVLPLMLGALVSYWHWSENGNDRWLVLTLLLGTVGTLIDWQILLTVLVVAADAASHWATRRDPRFLRASLAASLTGLGAFFAVATWVSSGESGAGELIAAASYRSHISPHYPWSAWLFKLIEYSRHYFTEPLLVAAALTGALLLRDALWYRQSLTPERRLLALLGAAGILPIIVFPNGARYHAYWQFYLLPYMVLSLAHALRAMSRRLEERPRRALWVGTAVWIFAASTMTLRYRYAHPSAAVAQMLIAWRNYL